MRYTITALSSSQQILDCMYRSLLAIGAPASAIVIHEGRPGISQPQISVKTDDLEASESFQEALELCGGSEVASHEESSVFDAVTFPDASPKR